MVKRYQLSLLKRTQLGRWKYDEAKYADGKEKSKHIVFS
jgi:hypothetical protein